MRLRIICDPIARSRAQSEDAAIFEFCIELACDAKQDVALAARVVAFVSGRVLDHPKADIPEPPRAPPGHTAFAPVFRSLDR